ncbi:MAG: UDP-galactopyranose mutase, partial [Clostridia bacterium]|nr:UDP-galactopyranose mutase [Clostridia bacterium]
PILTEASLALYNQYSKTADTIKNLVLCGRLAEFKYYNMDQVIERALDIFYLINKLYWSH